MGKRIEPPLVLTEIDDLELMYFESVEDMLSDRFDILWDEKFEGWDSRGLYFRLERRYRRKSGGIAYGRLTVVTSNWSLWKPRRLTFNEVRKRTEYSLLEPLPTTAEVAYLIQLGLDRELKLANQTYRIR